MRSLFKKSQPQGCEPNDMMMTEKKQIHSGDLDNIPEVEAANGDDTRGNWSNQIEFILSCIGFAVGIGNIWRFPYLCMRNGGGAFLIPYFTSLFICGMPLFFLELSLGQFSGKSPLQLWSICPLFKGLGYSMLIISGLVCVFYNVILSWVLYYLFNAFTFSLPWSECGNGWNTPLCRVRSVLGNITLAYNATDSNSTLYTNEYNSDTRSQRVVEARSYVNLSANETIPWRSPAEEYWQNGALELTSGIEVLGGIKLELMGCLFLSWVIVFLCLFKGVQSSGKVVYVTATMPYVLLTILLIRGLMLPGAIEGIKYFIIPDWSKLLEPKVWAEASLQIFYSLGPAWGGLITMASYNKFNNNCLRDGILVPLVNCGTSFYGGFVIFSVIGFMAHEAGLPVKDVVTSGPGLAFIVYPEAISKMPISPLWAILFFVMLLVLSLDTQFGMLETVTSSIADEFPSSLRKHKILFTASVCLVEFAIGIPLASRAGMYIFQLFDWYVGSFSLMIIALFECLIISWVYGHHRIYADIELMIGSKLGLWWKICWAFLTPLMLLTITIYNTVAMGTPYYGSYTYPSWAITLGWTVGLCPIIPIIWCFFSELRTQKGTLLQRLKQGLKPNDKWGPSDPQYKLVCNNNEARENLFASPLLCVSRAQRE